MVGDTLLISSHKGEYRVEFEVVDKTVIDKLMTVNAIMIIDQVVFELYNDYFSSIPIDQLIILQATENTKSIKYVSGLFDELASKGLNKKGRLIAVGGGIIQDVTCFVSSCFMRGVPWTFIPTTLLAQADSCIGSKSSINGVSSKNLIGTFYPPYKVMLDVRFLETLSERDRRSGVGEILKVASIDHEEQLSRFGLLMPQIFNDLNLLSSEIHYALKVKKRFIEIDEFDQGPRNIFNYGHTFGHAIEAATGFAIPHGIAVAFGMDMSNFICHRLLAQISRDEYVKRNLILQPVFELDIGCKLGMEVFFAALNRDKKNEADKLGAIFLSSGNGELVKMLIDMDVAFRRVVTEYLETFFEV